MSYFAALRQQAALRQADAARGHPPGTAIAVDLTPPTPNCKRLTYPVTSDHSSKVPARLGGGPHTGVQLGCLPDPEGFCCYCGNRLPAKEV